MSNIALNLLQTYAREDLSAVYLYRVLLGDDLDLIAISKPYKQSQLSTSVSKNHFYNGTNPTILTHTP
jgi:hypothetical protein